MFVKVISKVNLDPFIAKQKKTKQNKTIQNKNKNTKNKNKKQTNKQQQQPYLDCWTFH